MNDMDNKIFVVSFIFSFLIVPLYYSLEQSKIEISIVLGFLGILLVYYIYPRYKLKKSLEKDTIRKMEQNISVEGEIVSGEKQKSPLFGRESIISIWSIYEWNSQGRNSGWKTAGTGIEFGEDIKIVTDDNKEFIVDFPDEKTSRSIGFLSLDRLKKPMTTTSGTLVNEVSAEIRNNFKSKQIKADQDPTDRIIRFLDNLETDIEPTDKNRIFGKRSGDRKYTESYVDIGDKIFVHGKSKQSKEFGTDKIVPFNNKTSIITDLPKYEYNQKLESKVSIVSGISLSLLVSSFILFVFIL